MKKTAISTAVLAALFCSPLIATAAPGNGSTPNLNQLDCTQDQIPKFDETADSWVCADQPTGGSGGGLQLLDGNEAALGDVLLVESSSSVWANLNVVNKITPAQVTVTVGIKCAIKKCSSKFACTTPVRLSSGVQCVTIGGNVADTALYYDGTSCSGTGYVRAQSTDTGFLSFLESDTVYLMLNQARDMWTEVVVDSSAIPGTQLIRSIAYSTGQCSDLGLPINYGGVIPFTSFGTAEPVPILPLSVEEEP